MSDSPIAKVLMLYGAVKVPSGRGWRSMKCPFHSDRHASATVNTEVNAFSCFACSIKGDLYKIIMEQEGIGFREAKSRAEEITGTSNITLPKVNQLGRRVPRQEGTIIGRRREVSSGSGQSTTRRSRSVSEQVSDTLPN